MLVLQTIPAGPLVEEFGSGEAPPYSPQRQTPCIVAQVKSVSGPVDGLTTVGKETGFVPRFRTI